LSIKIKGVLGKYIAIPIVVRYRVLGFEESGVRSQESGVRIQDSGFRIRDSGVKILVYLMRLGNAIYLIPPTHLTARLADQFCLAVNFCKKNIVCILLYS
jgi:hypothetical protein